MLDFSKEYCNLMCAEIKFFWEREACLFEQSLPLEMRAFDDLYLLKLEYFKTHEYSWALKYNNFKMVNSIKIEIFNNKRFEDFEVELDAVNKKKGDFEEL